MPNSLPSTMLLCPFQQFLRDRARWFNCNKSVTHASMIIVISFSSYDPHELPVIRIKSPVVRKSIMNLSRLSMSTVFLIRPVTGDGRRYSISALRVACPKFGTFPRRCWQMSIATSRNSFCNTLEGLYLVNSINGQGEKFQSPHQSRRSWISIEKERCHHTVRPSSGVLAPTPNSQFEFQRRNPGIHNTDTQYSEYTV
jgi:hypothetical protein